VAKHKEVARAASALDEAAATTHRSHILRAFLNSCSFFVGAAVG